MSYLKALSMCGWATQRWSTVHNAEFKEYQAKQWRIFPGRGLCPGSTGGGAPEYWRDWAWAANGFMRPIGALHEFHGEWALKFKMAITSAVAPVDTEPEESGKRREAQRKREPCSHGYFQMNDLSHVIVIRQ